MSLSEFDRAEFLRNAGWSGASVSPLGADWSHRQFFRAVRSKHSAILIHSVPDDDPHSVPGHKLRDFVEIGRYLSSIELSVPEIYAVDLSHGLILVEDFGHDDFTTLIEGNPARAKDLYKVAVRCLEHIYKKTEFVAVDLPDYYKSHVHTGRRRVVDWYLPSVLKQKNPDGLAEDYLALWKGIERHLPPVYRRFQHGDFHPGNLMYLPDRIGYRQAGVLDFQGAMMGPAPYDLVNLLEDARRIVPDEIRTEGIEAFSSLLKGEERESFLAWYPVLSAQFHFRVIGQAVKLAVRDGKTALLGIVPVLQNHILRDLQNPLLAPMKKWFDIQGVDFSVPFAPDLQKISAFIRSDAF